MKEVEKETNSIETIQKKKENKNHELKDLFMEKKEGSHKTIVQDKLDIMNDEDKRRVMIRKGIIKEGEC